MRLMLVIFLLTMGAQGQLCSELAALTQAPEVAAAHWGYSVTRLDGTRVCGLNEGQLFRPASNAKLFTTAAALGMLGAAHADTTVVTGTLDPGSGTVTGDLILVGGGDPNLDSNDLPYALHPVPHLPLRDLEDLARQLQAAGVRRVTGDVVGDDTLFPYEPYPSSWSRDDLVYGYGAPVSALTVADNQLKLTIAPPGNPASVTLEQNGIAYYTVVNQVRTMPAKFGSEVRIERTGRTIRVYGTIALDSPPDVEEIAIDDPAAYAAMVFRSVLLAHGITVAGGARARHQWIGTPETLAASRMVNSPQGVVLAPPADDDETGVAGELPDASHPPTPTACLAPLSGPLLASHASASLGQDVRYTLKASQNLHAELTLHALTCGSSTAVAARAVRAFLTRLGIGAKDFIFYDGSGLSDHDLVTPRAVTQLLVWAAAQPWFGTYKAALPLGGTDGTLQHRFTGALKGKVFAKTGTLGESRALSGYVVGASGQMVVFSILADDHYPGTPADRVVADKMVEMIAAEN